MPALSKLFRLSTLVLDEPLISPVIAKISPLVLAVIVSAAPDAESKVSGPESVVVLVDKLALSNKLPPLFSVIVFVKMLEAAVGAKVKVVPDLTRIEPAAVFAVFKPRDSGLTTIKMPAFKIVPPL